VRRRYHDQSSDPRICCALSIPARKRVLRCAAADPSQTEITDSTTASDIGNQVLRQQLHADNITDSEGITEGDPRDPTAPNGRAIFGRSLVFSVGYDF
jgi:hypothetical protein